MTNRVAVNRTTAPVSTTPIVAPQPGPPPVQVRQVPNMNAIISDAQAILGYELRFYARRCAKFPESSLSREEAGIVAAHVRSLAMLATEEREARKVDDALSKLDDKQLVTLANAAIKALKDGAE